MLIALRSAGFAAIVAAVTTAALQTTAAERRDPIRSSHRPHRPPNHYKARSPTRPIQCPERWAKA